jgi:chromatin remodeling complex protein RSC6
MSVKSKDQKIINDNEVIIEDDGVVISTKKTPQTKETIMKMFDDLLASIESEILTLRESENKIKGVKFLRQLSKNVKILKNASSRIIKNKRGTVVEKKIVNTNSGFLKPVRISKEMAKFTGWNADELKSRVDVTKYLCNYIKEKNLQNPKDRRQIIADTKLAKLLDYDNKKDTQPLTYFLIQSHLKKHFIKSD